MMRIHLGDILTTMLITDADIDESNFGHAEQRDDDDKSGN